VRTVVVTIVHGRDEHLRRQREGLGRSTTRPAAHVVVRMDDLRGGPGVPAVVPTRWVDLPSDSRGLPLAAARNRGAAEAAGLGADLLVFLDVDCVPGPELVAQYETAARRAPDAVASGPVTYLPPPGPGGYDLGRLTADPHPARPVPADVPVTVDQRHELFWSLSFAVTPDGWARVGGFDEAYVGYGAEDTDFGQRARRAGLSMAWVRDAHAYHQHHPVSSPPVEHLDDILRNARTFHDRWGWWPMRGWLERFRDLGLVRHGPAGWERVPA